MNKECIKKIIIWLSALVSGIALQIAYLPDLKNWLHMRDLKMYEGVPPEVSIGVVPSTFFVIFIPAIFSSCIMFWFVKWFWIWVDP